MSFQALCDTLQVESRWKYTKYHNRSFLDIADHLDFTNAAWVAALPVR